MRPSRHNHIWEKKRDPCQEMDRPATLLIPASRAGSLTGWNRNIVLCKIGSLATFETRTLFILNSCELGHHLPISLVPLKEEKNGNP